MSIRIPLAPKIYSLQIRCVPRYVMKSFQLMFKCSKYKQSSNRYSRSKKLFENCLKNCTKVFVWFYYRVNFSGLLRSDAVSSIWIGLHASLCWTSAAGTKKMVLLACLWYWESIFFAKNKFLQSFLDAFLPLTSV